MSNKPNLTKKKNSILVRTQKPIITGWRGGTGDQRHRRRRERSRSDLQGCDKSTVEIELGEWSGTPSEEGVHDWAESEVSLLPVTPGYLPVAWGRRFGFGEKMGVGERRCYFVWFFLVWKELLINCCGSHPKVVVTVNGKRMTLTVN